jgi:hypothetical protein
VFAENIVPVEKVEETWAASVSIRIDADRAEEGAFVHLTDILKKHPGKCPVVVTLTFPGKFETELELPDSLRVNVTQVAIQEIDSFLGYPAVDTRLSDISLPAKKNGINGKRKQFGS